MNTDLTIILEEIQKSYERQAAIVQDIREAGCLSTPACFLITEAQERELEELDEELERQWYHAEAVGV